MSLFEFTFGLSAVILGLALTQMAGALHRLAIAGRRVTWAVEPLLLAALIFTVLVSVWLFQWAQRDVQTTTIGLMMLQALKLLFPFLGAAFVLPDQVPESGLVNLYDHYERTRRYTYGALIAGLLMFWIHDVIQWAIAPLGDDPFRWTTALAEGPWLFVVIYATLIVVRNRWFNRIVLTGALAFWLWQVAGQRLAA